MMKTACHTIKCVCVVIFATMNLWGYLFLTEARIFKAIRDNDIELTVKLAKNGQMEAMSKSGSTPLIEAAVTGNIEMVKALIENGANIGHCDIKHCSVLNILGSILMRIGENQEESVRELREFGFSEEAARNLVKASAVPSEYIPKEKQLREIFNYLREISKRLIADLMSAINEGDSRRVSQIAKKCLINNFDENNRTPLMFAVIKGNSSIVKILLDAGAETHRRNKLDLNVINQVEIILRTMSSLGTEGLNAAQLAWYEQVVSDFGEPKKELHEEYKKIYHLLCPAQKTRNNKKSSPVSKLFDAIINEDIAQVRKYVKKANLEATNSDGFTPLMMAALAGNLDVVKELLNAGARLETRAIFNMNVIEFLENLLAKCNQDIQKVRDWLHKKGMTDQQIEEANREGKDLGGYPTREQLLRLEKCQKVLDFLKNVRENSRRKNEGRKK